MSNLHGLQGAVINDAIVTSRDTNQTRKRVNNGDKGYILLWKKFH